MSGQPTIEASEATSSGAMVIAGRLLLLAAAAAAVAAAFVLSRGRDRAAASFGGAYTCPMHAEVTSWVPGECPVCRMALERVSATRRDAEAAESAFPESANQPNYKLIVSASRRAFPRTVRAPAWIEPDGRVAAILYHDELAGLVVGEPGQFFRAAAPTVGVDVDLSAEPPTRWDASTSRAAFRFAPDAPILEALEVGWVQFAARSQELLVVPASAVLVSPEGPYVLVAAPDGRSFTQRSLEIGQVVSGFVVVVSGLREGERVVVGNVFFLNAERRLGARAEVGGVTR